jgi:uncharacterized protein VirK/YbjX
MNIVNKYAKQFKNIIGFTPFIFTSFKRHYELYKVLNFYRMKSLIKFRTYGIYLFSYLSKQMTAKEKLLTLTHHYEFIKRNFKNDILKKIFTEGIVCWDESNYTASFKILLMASHYLEFEGSVTLVFIVNNSQIFNLNFSFAPGEIFGFKNQKTVIFISGLKGVKNQSLNIGLVHKTYLHLSPRNILMKVLESISICLGINTIIAVNTINQVSFGKHEALKYFNKTYDDFWECLSGEKLAQGYYLFKYPFMERPIESIKHRYKKRTIARRNKFKDISEKSILCFSNHILNHVSLDIPISY